MTHPPIKAPFELPQTEAGTSGEQELAFANYEDMIRRQACGDRSEQAVAKARAKLIATLSHPADQAGAVQAVSDEQLERMTEFAFASTNDLGEIGLQKYWYGKGVREGAALAATQPSAAPGDGQGALKPMSDKAMDLLLCPPDATMSTKRARRQIGRKVERDVLARLAAPGAAIAAREQEALVDALMLACEKFWWNDGPTGKTRDEMYAARTKVLAALASRSEAPAARPNAAVQEQGEHS